MQQTERRSPTDDLDLDEDFRPLRCPNCGAERKGEYCHDCGQRYLKARLTLQELAWIFADRFLDWEEGIWRTFGQMLRSPGMVIRHYLGGRRRTYLNPFSYLLFCAALYAFGQFLMRRVSGLASAGKLQALGTALTALNNVEDRFSLIAYGAVLSVAALAVAMRVMFDGRLLNAMEAVVTVIYTSGNVLLLALGVSAVEYALTGDPLTQGAAAATFVLVFPVGMVWSGYGLFEGWGMAGYSGVATFLGGFLLAISAGLLRGLSAWMIHLSGAVISGNLEQVSGQVLSLGALIGIVVLPAALPFLIDAYS